MVFEILKQDPASAARRGVLHTAHGAVQTPVFMPVGTQATVKAMAANELVDMGAEIILGNTYHLMIRPGVDIIREAGGLHRFMGWQRPILTDSGGYQVFSLSKLRRLTADGVEFSSHIDGNKLFLGPREAMAIQRAIGSDIAMVFDECTPYPATREQARQSLELTTKWAAVCREQQRAPGQLVFGIAQGSIFEDLRKQAVAEVADLDFDGIAIGGVSVGEPEAEMLRVLDWVQPELPTEKPHYLMGVGTPRQLVQAVARGVDMFDCVLPTRVARNGTAYTTRGTLPVKAGRFKNDFRPIEEGCGCYACQNVSRAYIRHLLNANEILGHRLMTTHNLHVYLNLMSQVRQALAEDRFTQFHDHFLEQCREGQAHSDT